MRRFIGGVFFILIIVGLATHMDPHVWVALVFYVGCAAIMLALIVRAIFRNWF